MPSLRFHIASRLPIGVLGVALWPVEAPSATEPAKLYADCMDLAREDPEHALKTARAWQDSGGGNPARHCLAMALISLSQYEQAAVQLEALAELMVGDSKALRAAILGQAAQAWSRIGQTKRALTSLDGALRLSPGDVDLLIDRSIVRGSAGIYREAIDDLNRVLELAPGRGEALILRASAHRHLDDPDRAREDVERAVALNPHNPEAFLERGIIRRLQDDENGARLDWLRVLELAPDAPVAEFARMNLEKLDLKLE